MTEPDYFHYAERCANCAYCKPLTTVPPHGTTSRIYCTKYDRPMDENMVCYYYETK